MYMTNVCDIVWEFGCGFSDKPSVTSEYMSAIKYEEHEDHPPQADASSVAASSPQNQSTDSGTTACTRTSADCDITRLHDSSQQASAHIETSTSAVGAAAKSSQPVEPVIGVLLVCFPSNER